MTPCHVMAGLVPVLTPKKALAVCSLGEDGSRLTLSPLVRRVQLSYLREP
jgi:hypothetical protein